MTANLHFTSGPAYAVAEITALAFMESAEPLLQEISSRTRQFGTRRLLINLLDVVGTMERTDHQVLGKLAVTHLAHMEKVASLVPEDKITRVSQETALGLGMQLRVFTSVADAIEWLVA